MGRRTGRERMVYSMKTTYTLAIRAFPVKIKDERTGEETIDIIVLDKQRLQAAELVDQSSKEIIHRIYHKNGYKVLDIGKPDKMNVQLQLDKICDSLIMRDAIGGEIEAVSKVE